MPKQYKDVEAQDHKDWKPQSDVVPSSTSALEYTIDTRTKFLYLGCWFVLNLVLTIYNKALLQGVRFIKENTQDQCANSPRSSSSPGCLPHFTLPACPSAATPCCLVATSS